MTRFRRVKRDNKYIMIPYEELSLVELTNHLLFDYGNLEKYSHNMTNEIKDNIVRCLKPIDSYDNLKDLDMHKQDKHYKYLKIQLDTLYNEIERMMDLLHKIRESS